MFKVTRPGPRTLVVSEPKLQAAVRLSIWLGMVGIYYLTVLRGPSGPADDGYQWMLLVVPLVLLPYLSGALRALSGGRTLVFDGHGGSITRGRRMRISFSEVRDLRLQTAQGTCEEFRFDAVLHNGRRVMLLEGKASAELSALAGQIAALMGVKLTRIV